MPSSGTRAYPTEDLVLGADAIFAVSPQVAAAALYGGVGSYTLNDAARAISALIGSPVAVQGEPTFLGRWTVGDGTSSSFTITHGLADGSPHVTVWDYSQAPPQLIGASVSLSGTDPENTIVVSAEDWVASPPGPGSIVVAIVGGPPAEGVEGADATMVFTDAGPLTIVNEPAAGNVLTGVDPNHAQFTVPEAVDLAGETARAEAAEALLAPKASPAFSGSPTAPTPAAEDSSTRVATTAYVQGELGDLPYDVSGAAAAAQAAAEAASDPFGSAAAAQAASIPIGQKGAASGVATLDSGSHIPSGQLPSAVANAGAAKVWVAPPTGVAGTDTANIQNAVTSLGTNPGDIILQPGNYSVNASINLIGLSRIRVRGAGREATTITCTSALNGSDATTLNDVFNANNPTGSPGSYQYGLEFSDMTIDCTAQNASGVPGIATAGYNLCAIECQNVDRAVFRRLKIIKAYGNALVSGSINPLASQAVDGAIVEDCVFVNCVTGVLPQYGIAGSVIQFGAMTGGEIKSCEFINSGGPAIDIFNCTGTRVHHNYFSGTSSTPVGSGQIRGGIHSDFGLQDCIIDYNVMEAVGPIQLNGQMTPTSANGSTSTPGPSGCTVAGNTLRGTLGAFGAITMISGSVTGQAAATVQNNKIIANTIEAPAQSAVMLYDGARCLIAANVITNVGSTGGACSAILLSDSAAVAGNGTKGCVFRGNIIKDLRGTQTMIANFQDNSANNTGNTFIDNELDNGAAGAMSFTTARSQYIWERNSNAGTMVRASVPAIASAGTLSIPDNGAEFFTVTGNTSITGILAGQPGRRVTLEFTATTDVFASANLILLSSPYVAPNTGTLTLVCDGANWVEVSRSAN